jgi:hypothetical protein
MTPTTASRIEEPTDRTDEQSPEESASGNPSDQNQANTTTDSTIESDHCHPLGGC